MADSPQNPLYVDTSGSIVPVEPGSVGAAQSLGYVPAAPQQIADYQAQQAFHEKYGGIKGASIAATMSAARAATFGLSDWVARETKLMPPEDILGYRQENPGSDVAGTVAGIAIPSLLTGGISGEAQGIAGAARAAGEFSAPGLIAKAGAATRTAVSGSLLAKTTSNAGRIAAKALGTGAGMGIESSAWALQNVISETALGNHDLNMEAAASQVGVAGLIGLAGGAVGSSVWNLGKDLVPGGVKMKLADWLNHEGAMADFRAAGAKGTDLKRLVKQHGLENLDSIASDARELGLITNLTTPKSASEKALAYLAENGPEIKGMADQADRAALEGELPKIGSVTDAARKQILKGLDANVWERGTARNFSNGLDALDEKYANGMTISDLLGERRTIGDEVYGLRNMADPESTVKRSSLRKLYGIVNDELRSSFKRVGAMDSDTVSRWNELNHNISVASDVRDIAGGAIARHGGNITPTLTELGAAGAGGVIGSMMGVAPEIGSELGSAAPDIAGKLVEGAGVAVHAGLGAAALGGLYAAHHRFPGLMGGAMGAAGRALQGEGLGPAAGVLGAAAAREVPLGISQLGLRLIQGSAQSAAAMRDVVDKSGAILQTARQDQRGQQDDFGTIGGNPEKLRVFTGIEASTQKVMHDIEVAAGAAVRGAPVESTPPISSSFRQDADSQVRNFDKRSQMLYRAVHGHLENILTKQVDDWDEHAPKHAQALNMHTVRALSYLQQSLPAPPPLAGPLDHSWHPSPSEMADFTRRWEAVNEPVSVLRLAAHGTLTTQAVEAVSTVYPELYKVMRSELMSAAAGRKPVPYTQRLMLSMFVGQDMDGSLSPSLLQSTQSVYAGPGGQPQQQQPQQQQGKKKATPARADKIQLARRSRTPSQAAADRNSQNG